KQTRAALLVLAVTGFVSIASEVTWTKTLVLLTGGTVYGFTLILAIFLSGLAAGATAARRFATAGNLGTLLLATGAALIVARSLLTWIPAAAEAARGAASPTTALFLQALFVTATLFPPTFLFGALFPTAMAAYAGDGRSVAARVGPAYALNTLASVGGSLAAGLWLIPRIGSDAVLAGCAVLLLAAVPWLPGSGRVRAVRTVAAAVGIAGVALAPGVRFEPLITSVRYEFDEGMTDTPRFHYLEEGRTGVISVVTYGSSRARLQSNGLNESLLDLEDPAFGSAPEVWLGRTPVLVHPDPETAFVAGYGGGVTARALLDTSLREVHVAELEAATVSAVRTVLGAGARLDDPRLHLEIEDARHVLLRTSRRFDVIVSQPSHPWRSGASALFTQEFFALVRSRLEADGVFAQWINLFNMDRTTLLSLAGTFYDTFPHGFSLAFPQTGDLILLGSRAEVRLPDDVEITTRFALSRAQWVALSEGLPRSTDRNLLAEMRLATLRGRTPAPQENPYALLDDESTYDLDRVVPPAARVPVLQRAADRFIARGDFPGARRVRERLAELDPEAAAALDRRLAGGLRGRGVGAE
ncbi:MAG: fused MFS/spermidine synthase, partial [Gemmatimonadetes bacterium]|nr:fused MFS/spermidine synthase [Gemmatimonadota bacterium]